MKLQINNLIDSRNKMRELYSKKYIPEPSNITITSIDEELINKAVTSVERIFRIRITMLRCLFRTWV
jgi:hypothetical protein